MRADNLEVVDSARLGDLKERYGAEWYLLHRVDLHTELLRLAVEPREAGEGEPVKIRLDAEVSEETDVETATIRLKSGEECKKDLIVAADGVHVSTSACILQFVGGNVIRMAED